MASFASARAVNRYLQFYRYGHTLITINEPVVDRSFIFIRSDRMMIKIFLDEILYLEAQRNYIMINTTTGLHRAYISISDIEEKLPAGMFVRVHRSFIISIGKATAYTSTAIMISKQEIPIGRFYRNTVSQLYKDSR